ncbi:MAG: RHS repeat domain-containing protein, partial [Bacilli bacterium]
YNLLNGLLKAIEEPNGTGTLYIYDDRGRVIQTIKTNNYSTYVDGSSNFYSKVTYQSLKFYNFEDLQIQMK